MRLARHAASRFPDLATREVRVDGQRVVYTEAGSRPTVLLLHGAVSAGNVFWWELQQALAPYCRTIAPDFLGWGDSAKPRGAYGMARYMGFVEGLLDTLALDRVPIVGHSMGGLVGSAFTLQQPGRVESLVTLAVPPAWADFALPSFFRPLLTPLLGELVLAVSPWLGSEHPHGVRRAYSSLFLAPERLPADRYREVLEQCCRVSAETGHREAFLASIRSTNQLFTPPERARLRALAAASEVPMLVVAGREDPMFPLALFTASVPDCPPARLVVLDDCGHFPTWEQPARVAALIEAFTLGRAPLEA